MRNNLRGAVILSLLTMSLYSGAEAATMNDFISGSNAVTGTVHVTSGATYEFDANANGTLQNSTSHQPLMNFAGSGAEIVRLNGNGAALTVKNLSGGVGAYNGAVATDHNMLLIVNDLNLTVQRTDAGGLCLQASNGSIMEFNGGSLTLNLTAAGAAHPTDVSNPDHKGLRGMKTYSDSGKKAGYILVNTDKFTTINTPDNIGLVLESQDGPILVNSNLDHSAYNDNAVIQLEANKIARVTGYAKDVPSGVTLNLTNGDSYIKGMVNTINRENDGGSVTNAEGLIRVLLQDGARWTVTQGAKNKNDINYNEYAFSNKVSRLTLTNKNTSQTGYVELASDGLGGTVTSLDVMKYDGNVGNVNSGSNLYGTFDMSSNKDHRVTIYSFIQKDAPYLLSSKGGNLRLDYQEGRSEQLENQTVTYMDLWGIHKYENNSDNLIIKVSDRGALETAHHSTNLADVKLIGDGSTLRVFNESTSPLTVENLTLTGAGKLDLGTMFHTLSSQYDHSHPELDININEARAHKLNVNNFVANSFQADFVQGTGLDTTNVDTQDHQNTLASVANLQVHTVQGDIKVKGNENQSLNLLADSSKTGNSTIVGNLIRLTTEGGTEGMVVNADMQQGTWDMSADNRLNTLNFGAGGKIGYMTKAIGSFNTLSIADLTGSQGTFYYTSDLEDFTKGALDENYSDIVKVTNGNDNGAQYTLRFRDNIKGVVDHWYGGDGVRVLQGLTNKADITTYVAGTSLLSTYNLLGEYRPNEADPTKLDYVITNVKTDPTPSPVVQGGETLLTGNILAYRLNQDTLLKRMGELRQFQGGEGTWARFRSSKFNSNKYFTGENTSQYYEFGYDNRKDKADGSLKYNGVAFAYGKNKTAFSHVGGDGTRYGHGEGDEKSIAYYDTYLGNKGHYLDLMAKAGYLTNDIFLEDSFHGYKGTGDYHNWAYQIGAEYGRQIVDKNNQWFIEPQAQLTLGLINGGHFNLGSDLSIEQNRYTSAVGRLGLIVGRTLKDTKYYAKISGLHEFAGRSSYDFTQLSTGGQRRENVDLAGTWGEFGLGVNAKIAKETFFNFDVERSFGNADYNMPWRFNVSMRWEF